MKTILTYAIMAGLICCINACKGHDADDPEPGVILPETPIETTKPGEDPETTEPVVIPPADPITLTPMQGEKSNADNCFAFKMFKEVSTSKPNMFFSPLSLNVALGMLHNGASGETRAEMAEVLGMGDFTETEINEYYQKMMQALLEIDTLTEIGIANSIWHRSNFPVKQPFIDVNKQYFDAMVQALDFSDPDAANIINDWCAEKTKNKIKSIVNPPIPDAVVMYLMNALYFKSKWQHPFDKKYVKQDEFSTTGNTKVKANMMEQTTYIPYYADEQVQCVELPYGNQAFSMVVVLPANHMDIEQLIQYLDNDTWQNIVTRFYTTEIKVKLPRFKIECTLPLKEPVMNVGMKQIFGGGLDRISDAGISVSNILQKTFVEVNEEGTEAAAVTVIAIATSVPPPPVPFFANRPFLYLIKEKSTGVILFVGRMDEPEE